MCTYSPKKIQLEDDTVCYKVLLRLKNKDGSFTYKSPYYRDTVWTHGKTATAHGELNWPNNADILEEGVFHAFRELKDAISLACTFNWHKTTWIYDIAKGYIVIGKFAIPKDAECVMLGSDHNPACYWNHKSDEKVLASNKITFIGEVDTEIVLAILEKDEKDYKDSLCLVNAYLQTKKYIDHIKEHTRDAR